MIQKKVVRICWNSKKWEQPSGPFGKSKSAKAYENKTGYGHEEWLFDLDKIIGGSHYGYLQAIGGHREKYVGHKFDISFYSINSATSERWWIGRVSNVWVVDGVESRSVRKEYKKRGWYDEMIHQLATVGANVSDFKNVPDDFFATVKFKTSGVQLLDPPLLVPKGDPAISSDYYNLKNWVQYPALQVPTGKFKFRRGHNPKQNPQRRNYNSQSRLIDSIHNQIQNGCYKILCKSHGNSNVATEQDDGAGNRIDVVVRIPKPNKYWFFEIKTYNTASSCLREGISQLMEYAYYTDAKGKNVEKLIVVSPNQLQNADADYLQILRNSFGLPIFHQQFDIGKGQFLGNMQ